MANLRIAAVLTWVYAACFGIPAIPVAVFLRQRGTLPWFEDLFPMYGGPWSSQFDADAFTVALVLFLGLTLVAAWTAWQTWKGSKRGAAANLALLPVEAVFWLGFALPIPWIVGIARAALIGAAWNTLKRSHGPSPPAGTPLSPQ